MAHRDLRVTVTTPSDVVVVAIGGEIDLATIDQLRPALADPRVVRARHLMFDLTDVPFMSVRAYVLIAQRTSSATGVIICHDAAIVPRIFALLGVGGITFVSTRVDAG